jgi:hypothetical protein
MPAWEKLFPYGIQSESSTHRAHVDLENHHVIVFQTRDAIAILPSPIWPESPEEWTTPPYELIKPSWAPPDYIRNGWATARGVRIDWHMIPGARDIAIPKDMHQRTGGQSTSKKGAIACQIIANMASANLLLLPMQIVEVDDRAQQIAGTDGEARIALQVKHDGGCWRRGVFLQTHERNPLAAH